MLSRQRCAVVALFLVMLANNGCCWKYACRPDWCGPRRCAPCAPAAPACCEPSSCYKPYEVIHQAPPMLETTPPLAVTPGR